MFNVLLVGGGFLAGVFVPASVKAKIIDFVKLVLTKIKLLKPKS